MVSADGERSAKASTKLLRVMRPSCGLATVSKKMRLLMSSRLMARSVRRRVVPSMSNSSFGVCGDVR
jgi:hypothetical protein